MGIFLSRGRMIARTGAYAIHSRVLPFPGRKETRMTHRIAAIDRHKKVLMVVVATAAAEVADAAREGLKFTCQQFGTGAQPAAGELAEAAGGHRDCDGIHGAVLEIDLAGTGAAFSEAAF